MFHLLLSQERAPLETWRSWTLLFDHTRHSATGPDVQGVGVEGSPRRCELYVCRKLPQASEFAEASDIARTTVSHGTAFWELQEACD